ncbi:MAG: hypothetical protein ACT4PV_04040 [Planctomycetaceae bacterium]
MPRLPLLLTPRNKGRCALAAAGICTLAYMFTNRVFLGEPRTLPLTALDEAIPFLPWTFWIYISESFLFLSVYFLAGDLANLNRFLYSIVAAYLLGATAFLFWPTVYPRQEFPLGAETGALTRWAFSTFRAMDSPASCFPSLHVATCYLAAFLFLAEQRRKLAFSSPGPPRWG